MSTSPTPNPQVPNPESNPDVHQAPSTESTQATPATGGNTDSPTSPVVNNQDPTQPPVVQDKSLDTPDTLSNQPKANQVPLSNDVQPRQVPVNEEGIHSSTEAPISYQPEPVDETAGSQLPQELQDMFKEFEDRTGKPVNVFQYDSESKKADIRIEGYSARQTQQVITSNPAITSIGRDDFREVVRVGTEPSPIRDRYCFNIMGQRVEYFD